MTSYHNSNDRAFSRRSIFGRSQSVETGETIHPEEPIGYLHQNFRHWTWLNPPSSFSSRR